MNPVNKILLGLGALIALVIVIAFSWLSIANARLKSELAQAQANDTACHLANDAFVTQVERQNKAVEKLRADSIAHEKRAQAAFDIAQEKARIYFLSARKLDKIKKHGDACQAADNIFNQYIGKDR